MSLYCSGPVRVVTDPDAKYFESGTSVVRFYGGLNEGKDKNGEYIKNGIEVEAWNKTGQVIIDYAPKGSIIHVSGYLHREEWDDKDTGAKRSKHILKANRIELLPSNTGGTASSAPAAAAPDDDEIPF